MFSGSILPRLFLLCCSITSLLAIPSASYCAETENKTPSVYSASPEVRLTVIPPSPITDQIVLDVRGGFDNAAEESTAWQAELYFDKIDSDRLLQKAEGTVAPKSCAGVYFRCPAAGRAGRHDLILTLKMNGGVQCASTTIEILPSPIRSVRKIDGAWSGIVHWSEQEGKRWNPEIRKMKDGDWRELMRAMNEIEMNIVVIEETLRHQEYHGKHQIEKNGYKGLAFYPSQLYPGRMEMAAKDPIDAILSEADMRGMFVFLGVGMYAWFDFTPASLEWHKRTAEELWQRYGHHSSFYGWYISEEAAGSLAPFSSNKPEDVQRYREEIVQFFKGFREYVQRFAPEKPIMLAPNCHSMKSGEKTWCELLKYCDIVCPFGFHRMPENDVSGEEAAQWLQTLCDEAGAHLWMDMEVFLFGPENDLYPRPIDGLVSDLVRFPNFEKILCFQYPGLMNAQWASLKPGGPDTVKLYEDYKKYLDEQWLPQHQLTETKP
ncbi:MAG: DUF4434 domain-containing protein [Candidatus Omnitrophota bacterium]